MLAGRRTGFRAVVAFLITGAGIGLDTVFIHAAAGIAAFILDIAVRNIAFQIRKTVTYIAAQAISRRIGAQIVRIQLPTVLAFGNIIGIFFFAGAFIIKFTALINIQAVRTLLVQIFRNRTFRCRITVVPAPKRRIAFEIKTMMRTGLLFLISRTKPAPSTQKLLLLHPGCRPIRQPTPATGIQKNLSDRHQAARIAQNSAYL